MMRIFLLTAAAAVLPAAANGQVAAVVGGTVIDGTGGAAVPNGVVLIRNGKIACVGAMSDCPDAASAKKIDAAGKFVTPGLVDAHMHLNQTGWLDGRPDGFPAEAFYSYAETQKQLMDDPRRWPLSYLCSGVTAAFDVGGMPWTVKAAHAESARPDGLHMRAAGPLITHAKRPMMNLPDEPTFLPMETVADAEASVAKVVAMGADAVKIWYLAPAPADRERRDGVLMAAGAAAKKAGLPLIVHATGLREAKMALKAGATMLVHSVFDQEVDDEFISLLKENDATYSPTVVVPGQWTRAIASVVFGVPPEIDDPNNCVDAAIIGRTRDVGNLKEFLAANATPEAMYDRFVSLGREDAYATLNVRRVHEAGGRIVVATDAGNPMTLHGASMNWELEALQQAGIPPEEIIPMATRNGAIAMGAGDEFGTLEEGKAADLLILAKDPREDAANFRSLTHVMRGGRLWTQEELRRR